MTYHLIATRTVHPTLKSARELNERPFPPQILASCEDPEACWKRGVQIVGKLEVNELALCLNGLPLKVTAEWTYWIAAIRWGSVGGK